MALVEYSTGTEQTYLSCVANNIYSFKYTQAFMLISFKKERCTLYKNAIFIFHSQFFLSIFTF